MKVTITNAAKDKFLQYEVPKGAGYRLSTIFSGGCSYVYNFDLAVDFPNEEDTKFEDNGLTIYLDPLTIKHINEDLKFDYVQGKGFRIIGPSEIYSYHLEVKQKANK
ncbi:HesB/IscA family protein [Bacillus sp. B1-b2]|uniref:HesB/IscA family protein n=1 Tax=Bacillus sp. B1-b2 TaxID=2653201 RepID=UPI001261A776|nr:iron-sulfur cluster biosynthesis family protein [Bacillus sp. B1-b2]KAB7671988.1 hypothetical protein F9279_03440 [Bacillus sp. B1-b2]